jgi:hypothetical protein
MKKMVESRASRWRLFCSRSVQIRALKTALLVGTILVAINHPEIVLEGYIDTSILLKSLLTYCVPYAVSSYASVLALSERN